MTKISLIALAIIIAVPNTAVLAVTCTLNGSTTYTGGCENAVGGAISVGTGHCTSYYYTCHGDGTGKGTKVEHCTGCESGYETDIKYVSDSYCTNIAQTVCVKSTSTGSGSGSSGTCDNATCTANNNSWVAYLPGVQKQEIYACMGSTCKLMGTNYRCAQSYYGSPNATTICNECPSLLNLTVKGLSAAGSKKITDCYWPSGGGGNDGTGQFNFTSNCYYTE